MKRFRPLSQSLTYRIMAVVLVMMAVITGIVYFSVRKYMQEEAQERYWGILQRNYEDFKRRLSDVYVAAKNNVHDIEGDIDHPDLMYDHIERILTLNPSLRSTSILFTPDYYPEKGRFFAPMVRRDSLDRIRIAQADSTNSYHQAAWYRECMANDTALWVDAYYDLRSFPTRNRRTMLTTYAAPIHDRLGKPVAMLCVQLSRRTLHNVFVKEIKRVNEMYEQGHRHQSYCFVIDRHGNYIMHPEGRRIRNTSFLDQTKETPDTLDDRVVARMLQEEDGEARMDIGGVLSWVYYRTLNHVNWTMVVVVPEDVIYHNGRVLNVIILIAVLIGLVVIYFTCRHMIRQMTKPLHSIALSVEEVAKGNFSSPLPDVKSVDEVRMLRDSFEVMQASLSIFVDELRSNTAEKAAFENEMTTARDIQMSLVPSQFPPYPERSDIDIYGMMEPAKSVGGDLYDFLIRDEHLFFCIGDVSGKGVPAALLMAVTRSLFHSVSMNEQQPDRIMGRINSAICEGNKNNMFVTMFIGILDLTIGHLDYCNAGQETPLLAGQPLPIKRNKPVGALSEWTFEAQKTQLQPGDVLFLYSDGLTEARNQTGKRLGRAYVAQLAGQHASITPQQLVQLMAQEVYTYAADTEQSDDITLLAIKWENVQSSMFNLQCSLQPSMDEIERLKPFINNAALQAGIDTKEAKRLRAATEEAVANVINYGQATTITLQAKMTDGQLIITIDDDGLPFDPTQGSATDLSIPTDQRPSGGMGILMLQRMTDGLNYQRTDGHNILTLIKLKS